MGKARGQESERGLEQQAATFLERARNLDLDKSDVITMAAVAGLGLATVAAILAARRLKNRIKATDGEEISVAVSPTEYLHGMASFVGLRDGRAASFPADPDAKARLRAGTAEAAAVFMMEPGGEVVRGADHDPRYRGAARHVIGLVQGVLPGLLPRQPESLRPPEE
jgi:hypothetical protein